MENSVMDDVSEKIQSIITKKFKINTIDLNEKINKLGLDSLDVIDLVVELEQIFKIKFINEELKVISTIADLIAIVKIKISK